MKIVLRSFVYLAMFATLFFSQCSCDEGSDNPTPSLTTVEKISKTWKLSKALINNADLGKDISTVRISLNQSEKTATTFTVTTTSAVPSPSGTLNTGNWALGASEATIIFNKGTANEYTVNLIEKTESSLKIKWVDSSDKNTPTYEYHYIPQ